mgnify:FL=1
MIVPKTTAIIHLQQRYLVVGLGLTGYSVASYLLRNGYDCVVQDDRQQPPYLAKLIESFPQATVLQQSLSQISVEDFDCFVVSPGLSIRSPLIKKVAQSGVRVIGDIELFAEAVNKPVLAITGSNGKSTVTQLVGEMIAADNYLVGVGGNIGTPALDLLEKEADYYVLELSSFQLETTHSLAPLVATVLNVSEDHMDRYDDLNDYQQTKLSISRNAQFFVSNGDDPLSQNSIKDIKFSIKNDVESYSVITHPTIQLAVNGEGWLDTSDLKIKGRHNWANCLAAMAMANLAGVSRNAIVGALKSFNGLPHRSEFIATLDGVSWINDSKATNPGAAQAAIDGMDEPVILIAGGQGKGADMTVLCDSLKSHVKTVLLIGQDAELMQQSWSDCVAIERVENMAEAVKRARVIATEGDVVLLSPACASFDMYTGFEARGNHFATLVRSML